MNCVAYMRVSTEKQAEEGYGLDSQKRDIEEFCRRNQYIITEWYIDAGLSGMDMTKRQELQRLISDVKDIENIVVYKLDRLARDSVDALYMIEKIFKPKGVKVISVHDYASYETPQDKFQTHIMAAVAEYDRNTMMLRMRGGMLERVKKGYWMGGGTPPYCYSYDRNKGYLVPIPERAKQARKALNLFIQGYSDLAIQLTLGFKTEQVVRNILTGRVNIGEIPYKGKYYKGLHEPIFDIELFEQAQALRQIRHDKKTTCINKEPNLLTGLCYCGVCGCKMRYQKWDCGLHKIYCCSRNKYLNYLPNYNSECDNTIEWAADIEKQVEEEIIKISLDLSNHAPKAKETELEILENQLDKQQSKLKRLYNLYAEGNDTIIQLISDTEHEIEATKEHIVIAKKREHTQAHKDIMRNNIKSLADIWTYIDKTKKNTLLKTIIDKIVIDKGNIEIQLKNF